MKGEPDLGEIIFDFCSAAQALAQAENIAERMRAEIVPDFCEMTDQVSGAWGTEAGAHFAETAQRELEKLKGTEKLASQAASSLRAAVAAAQEAEEKAKETARLRRY